MKYLDDYRQVDRVKLLAEEIKKATTQNWKIMEICGGQTHTIAKYGLFDLLPPQIELIHGPGCPVCVTPKTGLDHAMQIAKNPKVIFCSFGDMLRVPGSQDDLLAIKALGGNIKIIYSPLEVIQLALEHPDKEIVLFAVGFETTAPAHAMAVKQAIAANISNFSLLASLVLVPPAIEFILQSPSNQVQGFLAAGHVCTIMGDAAYHPISAKYQVPIIITGFEPVDILLGIYHCVKQLEQKQAYTENHYARSVKENGNIPAQRVMQEIFDVVDKPWRGIGTIPLSGYHLKKEWSQFDAAQRFPFQPEHSLPDNHLCISGKILQGINKPHDCTAFGKQCTPETPLGAPMVSTEGACAAYYRYLRKS